MKRRSFIEKATLGTIGIGAVLSCKKNTETNDEGMAANRSPSGIKPLIISTWNHG